MAKLVPGVNDLGTVNPELAAELVDPSLARTLTRSSGKSVGWFCVGTDDLAHPRREWSATVNNRSNGSGCAACSGQAVIVGWNDLATVEPDLAAELVDLSLAQTLTRSSGKSVSWFCVGANDLPHPRREWSAPVYRRANGKGCAACAGREVIVGWNDLATVEPDLAGALVDPILAQTLTRSSGKKVGWFCDGTNDLPHPRREWSAPVNNRSNGRGCAACAGREVIVGWNDLATVEPGLVSELVDPSLAQTLTRSSHKSVSWFCVGTTDVPHPRREWSALVSSRSAGTGCAACSGNVVLVGWNDLATLEPALTAELVDPSLARKLTRSSNRSVGWFCVGTDDLAHPRREWSATVNNRSNGIGCAACGISGYNPLKPGWLYLMRHDGWDMQQIGITNVVDQRIGRHERSGWQLVDIRQFDDGELCAANERAGLAALRLRGARLGNSNDVSAVRFDGYTEAWPTHTLEITDLNQLLEWVRDDEFNLPVAGDDR